MQIVSLVRRPGGTEIELFGKKYHFRPDAADESESPAHVCDIEDPAAIHRLLTIKEGYAKANSDEEVPALPAGAAAQVANVMKSGGEDKKVDRPPVIITNDQGEQVNLTEMELDDLKRLATEEFKIKLHHKWTHDTIVAKIVEAMRAGQE